MNQTSRFRPFDDVRSLPALLLFGILSKVEKIFCEISRFVRASVPFYAQAKHTRSVHADYTFSGGMDEFHTKKKQLIYFFIKKVLYYIICEITCVTIDSDDRTSQFLPLNIRRIVFLQVRLDFRRFDHNFLSTKITTRTIY
jgi:hypothetical protein